MSVTLAYDATHANIGHLPAGQQAAGYSTGPVSIRWTGSDFAAHPGAVRICQDAAASDATADILDVERYAATNNEAAGWWQRAKGSYDRAIRPGQRRPGIYTSAANVTPLVNALIAGGVNSGPGLFVANWNLTEAEAAADVIHAAGPFPIIGVQFTSLQFYDIEVYSAAWLANVSGVPRRYVADGTYSLANAAARYSTTTGHIIAASMDRLNTVNRLRFAYYLGWKGSAGVMQRGLVYWV